MRATFCRASLLVHVDGEPQESDSTALSPGRNSPARSRILFHEAVHYWQQLSQGFLVMLADEEWARVRAYEKNGKVSAPGPVRREFERVEPAVGYSARHLHECLARYWEIMAFGPAQVTRLDWETDRTAAHPDFQKAWKQARRRFGRREDASGMPDLFTAMLMIGGEYATPFIDACHQFGHAAAFVFPWLAHLAFGTDRPAFSYSTLTAAWGKELAEQVTKILRDPSVPRTERYESTMVQLGEMAYLAFLRTLPGRSMTGPGMAAYGRSRLATNPAHAAMFDRARAAAHSLATTETVRVITRQLSGKERSRKWLFREGVRLLENAMATPGIGSSRALLQLAGLAPTVRYSNSELLPLATVWRAHGLADAKEWNAVDVVRALVKLTNAAFTDEGNSATAPGGETQVRWDAFARAEQGMIQHASS